MTRNRPSSPVATVDLLDALDEWTLVMRGLNRSKHTIVTYTESVRQLTASQVRRKRPTTVEGVTPADIRAYIVVVLEQLSASTAVTRWGGLLAFFKWATTEGLCADNPMADIERPTKPEVVIPIIEPEVIKALLAACDDGFNGLRDKALILFLLSTGCRREEAATITLDKDRFDLKSQTAVVLGKGNRERIIHFDDKVALALRRYLRARQRHHKAASTNRLWIGHQGPLGGGAIGQMLKRRAAEIDVSGINPHAWRHTFAHRWLDAGGTEGGLMAAGGWRTLTQPLAYAKAKEARRALDEHARLDLLGDL